MGFPDRFQPPTSSVKVPTGNSDLLQRSLHRIKSPSSTSGRSSYTQRFTQRYNERKQQMQQQMRDAADEKRDRLSSKRDSSRQQDLVCDYDQSVTLLYDLLENSKWEEARKRASTHPEECRTWIVRREKNSHQIRWKLLPLHASIIFQSPTYVVASIVDNYPDACEIKDDQGMLALHLALRHKHDDADLMELLLQGYPEAIFARDVRRRLPVDHGRDAKYTGQQLQLFAEAAVASNPRASTATDSHTATTANMTSVVSDNERKRIEAKCEVKLATMKQTYDKDISAMKEKLEERAKEMSDQKAYELTEVLKTCEKEKDAIKQQHEEDLREIEKQIAAESSKERNIASHLQSEIERLRHELQREQLFRQRVTADYSELQMFIQDLREYLEQIARDQFEIQAAAKEQKKAVESARRMRSHLLQSLVQQEQELEQSEIISGKRVFDIASRSRVSIENVRRRLPQRQQPTSPGQPPTPSHRHPYEHMHRHAPSYPEHVLQAQLPRDIDMTSPVSTKPATEKVESVLGRLDVERLASQVDRKEPKAVDVHNDEDYLCSTSPTKPKTALTVDTDYPEPTTPRLRVLGDEISAITELSPY